MADEAKTKKQLSVKALPIAFDDESHPHVLLDDATQNKLRAAMGICLQIRMGEDPSGNAEVAGRAVTALSTLLAHSAKLEAPADGDPEA